MKKLLISLFVLSLIFSLAACGGSSAPAQAPAKEAAAPTAAPTEAPTPEPTPEPTPAPAAAWEVAASGVDQRDSYGTKWVRAWALIENTGDLPLYLESANLDIEDGDGKLVQSMSLVSAFPQVILPGQRAAYEEETVAADGLPKDGLSIYSRYGVSEAGVEPSALEVRELEVYDASYGGVQARGRVFNVSEDQEYSMIYAAVLCFDADGGYLGTLWTILDGELPAGERQGFETMASEWFKAADVASTEAYAYAYQYQW